MKTVKEIRTLLEAKLSEAKRELSKGNGAQLDAKNAAERKEAVFNTNQAYARQKLLEELLEEIKK